MLFEITADSVNENGIRFQRAQEAGLLEGEDTFHPAVIFIAVGSLAAFMSQDAEADHPFCMVVGWRHALLFEEKLMIITYLRKFTGTLQNRIASYRCFWGWIYLRVGLDYEILGGG